MTVTLPNLKIVCDLQTWSILFCLGPSLYKPLIKCVNDCLIAGIGIEGIGCMVAGAFGSGSGTTSYSENIGAIGITKVASL